jgi:two-component system, chemotaxis family, sensor kinase CheA
MDQFKQKAIEEAYELIADLEASLLVLEDNSDDKNHISKVFRIMHTLKGNSAMFGFDYIAEYTHHIESIYDLVRNDKLKLNKDIFDLTLSSVDHLNLLLEDVNLAEEANKTRHTAKLGELMSFVKKINTLIESGVTFIDLDAGKAPQESAPVPVTAAKEIETSKVEEPKAPESSKVEEKIAEAIEIEEVKEKQFTFLVTINPHKELLQLGTNPVFLFDDLAELGQAETFAEIITDSIDFTPLNPTECHVIWRVFVSTTQGIDAIKDVFIFVESDCDLDIKQISEDTIFERKDYSNDIYKILEITETKSLLDLQYLFETNVKPTVKETKPTKVSKSTVEEPKQDISVPVVAEVKLEKTSTAAKDAAATSIRVPSERLDTLMNLVSELVTTQARLSMFAETSDNTEVTAIAENVQKLTRQLRDIAFNICLVPIQNLLTRFQRLVRDLSAELKKDVELYIEGSETELDKSMIENLSDPIMHILRNSLDHGIELPEVREKLGKPKKAAIHIRAYYSGANVIIQITDDGAGIDLEKVRNKAISKGLVSAEANLSKKDIIDLLFLPGFSTAEKITGVSGRGVGMDVVRRKIMDIRGEVDVDSKQGAGTSISIRLPLTLSIIDGLLVEIDAVSYIIPLSVVDKCYAVEHTKIETAYNNIIVLDGEQIPFYYMREEFNCQSATPRTEQIIIVRFEEHRIGIVIDTIIGEYQAVLKPLGKMYKKQDIISGASILGDGTIALVLDSNKIIKRFSQHEMAI